jgi:putative DNA primase/helicase
VIRSEDIKAALSGEGWRNVLIASGIDESFLTKKQGPCPACGGKDRFRFDNKDGQGRFYCNQCGPGDGFHLLMRVHRIPFIEAKNMAAKLAGLDDKKLEKSEPHTLQQRVEPRAEPTRRVRQLLKESCAIENCIPVVDYLWSRCLWPLPKGHTLRAHPSVEYWNENKAVGRFPALLAAIRNHEGELVTVHATYLTPAGEKIADYPPRKILSKLTGHEGCAVQLMPVANVLGIAEGIETALSAAKLTGIATWSALNTSLLAKFDVPESVDKLVIFADRDVPGLEAAATLMQKLQNRVTLELRAPKAKDWNDVLTEEAA